ncbi:nuclear transport factor 2 family protein [Compostibacter hankyongensis]|uniref:SnoaL-like domain-containing protein n=1 Tax=Compostibacter hankyongensis TaxID=1007089 RepID=A0ABP8FQV7_9BACT
MTTQQIAQRLAALCREGELETAQKELYADDAISIEPEASPGFDKETRGKDAILEKGHQFNSMVEKVYSYVVSEPLISGNTFAFTLEMDIKMKGRERDTMGELCVYQVRDGKIVAEQFFM